MPFALEASGWIELAIAAGTFALALATVKMANASKALVEVTSRQFEESIAPVLRLVRIGKPRQGEMHFVNEGLGDEYLSLCLENRGQVPIEVGYCGMSPGGRGEISDPDEMNSPEIEPGQYREFEFHPSPEEKAQIRSGVEVTLRVQYGSVTSGVARAFTMRLRCEGVGPQDERWVILEGEAPTSLGRAFPN